MIPGPTAIDITEREAAISFREKRIALLDAEIARIRDQQRIMREEIEGMREG